MAKANRGRRAATEDETAPGGVDDTVPGGADDTVPGGADDTVPGGADDTVPDETALSGADDTVSGDADDGDYLDPGDDIELEDDDDLNPEDVGVADPAPASARTDASGAIVEPEIVESVPVAHPAIDANPRAGTTAEQNLIEPNDPARRTPADDDFTGRGLDPVPYGKASPR